MRDEPVSAGLVSLSDLKAKRAAMNGDRIAHGPWCGYCGNPFEGSSPGIVATHNAADVLIEICSAAMAWATARDELRGASYAAVDGDRHVLKRYYAAEIEAADALAAALAKIRP